MKAHHVYTSIAGVDVLLHVFIAERALGRKMPRGAEVHHVDANPRNNTNCNLVICQDRAYHKLLHARTRIVKAGGNPDTERLCSRCRNVKPIAAFSLNRRTQSGVQTACRECARIYWRDRAMRREKGEAA